jgi:hypothetical protein
LPPGPATCSPPPPPSAAAVGRFLGRRVPRGPRAENEPALLTILLHRAQQRRAVHYSASPFSKGQRLS